MPDTVLIHVQHLLGIGHQRRAALISRELCRHGFNVCYVSGGFPVQGLDIGEAELVQLPPARVGDAHYSALLDEQGNEVDDQWRERRKAALLQTMDRVRPSVIFLESFPFGRKMLSFELLALLKAACELSPSPLVVSSVRDILEPKRKPGRNEQIVEMIKRYFDLVLIHGDRRFVELSDSFALAAQIEDRMAYTGYVVEQTTGLGGNRESNQGVLISTGGGVGGEQLLKAAVAARALVGAAPPVWRCMVGHTLPESLYQELCLSAPPGMVLERNRSDFFQLLSRAAVSVSQAGYNTVIEILVAGVPAVLVPFSEANETEQRVRASLLNSKGLAELLCPHKLTPENLLAAIEKARLSSTGTAKTPDIDGAKRTAMIIKEQLRNKRSAA